MRSWQWILKWLAIRKHNDLKAIERAISLMGKLLPVLQGVILGTWTLVIAFKWSLTLYLWIEIVVTVFVGVGTVALRSRASDLRNDTDHESEAQIALLQRWILERRKRRSTAETQDLQDSERQNNDDATDHWNEEIDILRDRQRRTRREADAIEGQGKALPSSSTFCSASSSQ